MIPIVPTNNLFALAVRAGVIVEHHQFVKPILGIYIDEIALPPTIALHTTLLSHERLLRCVLAEELGHHFTCTGYDVATPYVSYNGRVLLGRTEKRALLWAGQVLMPEREVVREVRRGAGVENLADEFYVTATFVRAVLQLPRYVGVLGRACMQRGLFRMGG